MPAEDPEPRRDSLSKYLRYSHLGIQFFLAVGLFTGGGIWLDGRLGTGVLFTLLGLSLGFAGGFYVLYRDLFLRDDARHGGDGGGKGPGGKPRQDG